METQSNDPRTAITTAMESQGLTAYAVAKLAGLDPGVVKRFVDGKLQIKSDNLEKLMKALGLVIDYKS